MSGLGQSLGAALGQFAFGANSGDSRMKGRLDGIKAGLMDAQTSETLAQQLKVEAERRMLEQQEQARTPEALLRNAITQYAIPEDDMPAVDQFRKTGQLGGRYAPSIDGMGPGTPQPEWAKNLPALSRTLANTQRALTLGDKSVKSVAEADLIGRESAIGDDIIAGRVDPLKVSQSQFALKGSAPFSFQEYGTGNNLTGALNEETGAATRFGQKRIAETKTEQARAAASYASANSSNATAAKTNEERKQGKWQYDSARGGRVNVQTGEFEPIVQGGQPIGAASGGKPLPAAALKLQQEEIDAVAGASGIDADLSAVEEQLKSGALKLGPVSNVVGKARNMAGVSNEQSRNLQTFQSTLERLRNESLRLNKGVQTDGDSQRAWNELLTNINDPGVVAQRLDEIRRLNQRAAQLRTLNVDTIRNNYGAPPLDLSGRTDVAPTLGAPSAPRGSPRPAVVPDGPYSDAEKERRYQEFKDRQKP